MTYRQATDGCFIEAVGDAGLATAEFEPLAAEAQNAMAAIAGELSEGGHEPLALARETADLAELEVLARGWRERFADLVVLGTGGSSLGAQAVTALAGQGGGGGLTLHFPDNLDPHSLEDLFGQLDLADTVFLAVSKSGGTAETLSQLLIVIDRLRRAFDEEAVKRHLVLVAEPGENPLRKLAARFDLPTLDHSPHVGGRFSVLSLVGMLPALAAGLDAAAVRRGAAEVLAGTVRDAEPSPPAVGAAIAIGLLRERGIATTVMMPYANRLAPFAAWYGQLWAESLGKDGQGTTPVSALGPVDQHSQLQLYLDGPADKMFTLIDLERGESGRIDPDLAKSAGADYLAGHSIGDVVSALFKGTATSLVHNNRPTRIFKLPRLDEAALGGLFMHFMLETLIAARLLGVDAVVQPAVEEGKSLARAALAADNPLEDVPT